MVKTRRAGEADATLLSQLHQRIFADAWGIASIQALTSEGQAWVADIDGEPCGLLIARQIADEAEVLSLGVLPRQRRRGAARALVTVALSCLRRSGARSAFLEVAEDNAAALALYARSGFEQVARRRRYYRRDGGNSDALVLRADL
ncbi:MAG TPA: GNAT family N-acetyltransferase [Caulobacteraceae bacterium]|nr:GNAT family N-acetyltransferase [Caulobacteraceae bacterium]